MMRGRIVWLIAGAGALCLNVLAGHIEITLYTLIIVAVFAAMRLLLGWWRERSAQTVLATVGRLLAMGLLGIGLASIQFVPLMEFVQTNWRAERTDYATVVSYAHKPRDIVQFILPNIYGSPTLHSTYDIIGGTGWNDHLSNAAGQPIAFVEWGIKNYVEGALYLGILPLLLAVYALIDRWRLWQDARRERVPDDAVLPVSDAGTRWPSPRHELPDRLTFALLGGFSLTCMFGLPTYALVYALPGFNQLNSPFRWIFVLSFCVAMLAGYGMDAMVRRVAVSQRSHVSWVGVALLLASLLIFAGAGVTVLAFDVVRPLYDAVVTNVAGAADAMRDGRMLADIVVPQLLLLGAVVAAGGMLFIWVGRMRAYHHISLWQMLAVVLIAFDLIAATAHFNPASDPALLDFTPPEVVALQARQAQGERFRFTTLEAEGSAPLLNANLGWLYNLDDIRGYDSIISRDYVAYVRRMAPQGQLIYNRIAPLYEQDVMGDAAQRQGLDATRLDLLNAGYVLVDRAAAAEDVAGLGWQLDESFTGADLYRNPNAFPRAFTVPLSQQPPAIADAEGLRDGVAEAPIQLDTGREKFVDVRSEVPVWLIVSENNAPGWRAFVRPIDAPDSEEQAREVQTAFEILQAVELPAGDWTVRLVYSPTSFQVGIFGTVISAAAIVLMLGIAVWQRLVGPASTGDDRSQTARVARNSVAPILLNLFNRGIDFALLLVILRVLAPQDVGIYYYLTVIFVWFDIFTNFGLDLYLIREASRDRSRVGELFFNSSMLRLLLSTIGVALVVGFVAIRQATVTPSLPAEALLALGLLYVGLFPASLSKGITSLFYAYEQAEKPAAITTITSINKAVFGVIVLLLGWGIVGLAAVSIANNIFTFVVLMWSGRALLGDRSDWQVSLSRMRRMIRVGFPLMLNHFLATIFFQIDVIILEAIRGASIVARYSVAYKWVLAINIIPAFFTQALLPVMSRQAHEDRPAFARTYRASLKLLLMLALPTAVGFTLLAEPLTYIMGGAPYLPDGAIAIQLMIWSIPIGWMNSLTQYALVALDRQAVITRIFAVAVLFNIVSNLLLIPQYGYRAAALTTIASEAVLFVPFAWLVQRTLGDVAVQWRDIMLKPVLATVVMVVVALVMLPAGVFVSAIVSAGAYGVALLALRPFDAYEQSVMRRFLPQRLANNRLAWLFFSREFETGYSG